MHANKSRDASNSHSYKYASNSKEAIVTIETSATAVMLMLAKVLGRQQRQGGQLKVRTGKPAAAGTHFFIV
jgi:hypothetical protein